MAIFKQGNVKVQGLHRAVSNWCISNESMESIPKAYIHHFETATRVTEVYKSTGYLSL
jgi:hypothetical protein